MKTWTIEGRLREQALAMLNDAPWFRGLDTAATDMVLSLAKLVGYSPSEQIVAEGEPSDAFYLLVRGEIAIEVRRAGEAVEVGRVQPPYAFGEIALLLGKPRTATVVAVEKVLALRFDNDVFQQLFDRVADFRLNLVRGLAARVDELSHTSLPSHAADEGVPEREVLDLLPIGFVQRHRVLPLGLDGNALRIGFVDDPTPRIVAGLRQQMPGTELRPVRITPTYFDRVMASRMGASDITGHHAAVETPPEQAESKLPSKLRRLLERAVAEGASDLHLCAGRRPLWRIDGDIVTIRDAQPLGPDEVVELLVPAMDARHAKEFEERDDADFAVSLPGVGRFRVNIYRTGRGANAAMRQIPWKLLTLDQLGLPPVLKALCEASRGLVLVTGPTGSGKSTTLAAMLHHINRTRSCHIVTLEDPVEFIHEDQRSLVNQREVGGTVESFARGLRAALREDPDVVLLGEIRDGETAGLALEIANTGHLVFATLHTNSAIDTVDRLVDMFPGDVQEQARSTLAEVLRGVVSQTLLKARAGGRVAAVEVLVVNRAAASLIRERKSIQLVNVMQTRRKDGNQRLVADLARLVHSGKVEYEEALSKATDKQELATRLGRTSAV